jgi:plastocyanin
MKNDLKRGAWIKMIMALSISLIAMLLLAWCNNASYKNPTATENKTTENKIANPISVNQGEPWQVSISNFAFSPENITIKSWDTINWTNNDTAPHQIWFTVSWTDIKSKVLNKWDVFSYKFDNTWTIDYGCVIHPSMAWKIIIK